MGVSRIAKTLCALLLGALLVIAPATTGWAEDDESASNRYNVVVVVDASGSMNGTDPEGLRFEAIDQFVSLLAEQGNSLGGVVFTEKIEAKEDVAPANSAEDKARVAKLLGSVEARGDTNIGEALATAVDMLQKGGNKELPSVIVFLSDGNTDLPGASPEEVQQSLDKKADSVQQARQDAVRIYSVCLNADGNADVSEMQQISDATKGKFIEIKRPEDLRETFNTFYSLIYGTSAQRVHGVFPASGPLETKFEIPAFGVEEVNIVLYGNATTYTLVDPNEKEANPFITKANTFTLMKVTDVIPGTWTLKTEGIPGDAIEINMVFNTNLGIRVEADPSENYINPNDELTVRAYLRQEGKEAKTAAEYQGYSAELQVFDSLNDEKIDTTEMKFAKNCFEVKQKFSDGAYRLEVHVTGHHLDRSSSMVGPITVSSKVTSQEVLNNTPPVPVANPVEATVVVWPSWSPIGEKEYSLDLSTLATDEQDTKLEYAIASTSFMDGDYTVEDDKLTVTNFSISKGAFTVRAADSLGATCEIEVIVNSHNVATIVLIALLVGVVVAFAVMGFGLYKALRMFARGKVSVHSNVNGLLRGENDIVWRGRLRLSRCGLDPVGLNYNKSYIQATGKQYAILKTNIPVRHAGQSTKGVRLANGATTIVTVQDGKSLEIRFDSDLEGSAFGPRAKRPKPPKVPKRPRPPRVPKFSRGYGGKKV